MHAALENLRVIPEYIIVDGNKFKKYKDIEHRCIIKGDSKYLSIAAASIIAKNYRDKPVSYTHLTLPTSVTV